MKIFQRETCRASKGDLVDVFDLGELPISCFPEKDESQPQKSPLKLALNKESGLLQLRHSVDPDVMYNQYWYMSGVNLSMTLALKSIVDQALKRNQAIMQKGDIILDIACNDGTLLSAYPDGYVRVGIDPAKNIKPKACDFHVNTYFSAEAFKSVMGSKKAKIVTSIAMFYDLEDPVKFSKDVKEILHPDGMWIVELSYLPTMLERNSFDTICAEHLEYYSLTSMEFILGKAGLKVEDVELNDVNGGSFRLYIRYPEKVKETDAVRKMRENEKTLNLNSLQVYTAFATRVAQNKREMIQFLTKAKKEGKLVIGYGASTKGNTILAYYGIGPDLLPFVADRNSIKWGRETVTRIPIISEDEARRKKPDYFLAFPYHFMNEFLQRETEFIKRGGKFVSPVPKLTFFP